MLPRITCLALLLLLAGSSLLLTACNTVDGLGKDVEKGGQKLQHASGKEPGDW